MWDLFKKTWSDTFRSVLVYERNKDFEKKYFVTVQKNSSLPEDLTVEARFILDIEKSNSKWLFLNDSKCKSITRG